MSSRVAIVNLTLEGDVTVTGVYEFDRANGGTLIIPSGTAFPTTNVQGGELFYRTDEERFYRRNDGDTAWNPVDPAPVDSVNGFTGAVVLGPADVGAEVAGAVAAHEAAGDPHPQYTTAAEAAGLAPVQSVNTQTGAVVLDAADVGADPAGTAAAAVVTHEGQADPHPQYTTPAEAAAAAPVQSVNTQTGVVSLGAGDVGADPAGTAAAAVLAHEGLGDPHPGYQLESEKGVANGYPSLDATGKVPASQLPALTGLSFQGLWDASTNTPTLASGVGTEGHFYIVSVAGSTNLDGETDWQLKDWAIFTGGAWRKLDNSDSVVSVNGQTGVVTLTLGDLSGVITAAQHGAQTDPTLHAVATGLANGFMSSADFSKLLGIEANAKDDQDADEVPVTDSLPEITGNVQTSLENLQSAIAGAVLGDIAAAVARRTTDYDITGVWADVSLDTTSLETDASVIEHGSGAQDDRLLLKDPGAYLVFTSFEVEQDAFNAASFRVRLNDTTTLGDFDELVVTGVDHEDPSSPVVQYFLNEANTGQGPANALDNQSPPFNLPWNYSAVPLQPVYTQNAQGRGVEWTTGGDAGEAQALTTGSKVETQIAGTLKATWEIVVDVDAGIGTNARIVHIEADNTGNGRFTVAVNNADTILVGLNGNLRTFDMSGVGGIEGAGMVVLHAVFDSTEPVAADRLKLYRNGVLVGGAGSTPALNETITFNANNKLWLGNRFNDERSFDGRLFYAALYPSALDAAKTVSNATSLLANHDMDPNPQTGDSKKVVTRIGTIETTQVTDFISLQLTEDKGNNTAREVLLGAVRLRGPKGDAGPAGTGQVNLEDDGSPVAGGPFDTLNFANCSVSNDGGGKATVTPDAAITHATTVYLDDAASAVTFTTGRTPVPFDDEDDPDAAVGTLGANGEFTVASDGVLDVQAEVTIDSTGSSSRSRANIELEINTGAGFTLVPGTTARAYVRQANYGDTPVFRKKVAVSAGDVIRTVAFRTAGAATLRFEQSSRMTITKLE